MFLLSEHVTLVEVHHYFIIVFRVKLSASRSSGFTASSCSNPSLRFPVEHGGVPPGKPRIFNCPYTNGVADCFITVTKGATFSVLHRIGFLPLVNLIRFCVGEDHTSRRQNFQLAVCVFHDLAFLWCERNSIMCSEAPLSTRYMLPCNEFPTALVCAVIALESLMLSLFLFGFLFIFYRSFFDKEETVREKKRKSRSALTFRSTPTDPPGQV